MDQVSGKYGGSHKPKQSPGSFSVTCWNNNSYAPNTPMVLGYIHPITTELCVAIEISGLPHYQA